MRKTTKNTASFKEPDVLAQADATDDIPWFALQLFTIKQQEIAESLKDKGLVVFIPMEYVDIEDRKNHIKHVLRPVVRNLLFVKNTIGQQAVRKIIQEIPYPISVIRKERGSFDFYEIPARQMFEFMAMCNPDILMKKYISEEQAKLKSGTPVIVTHGPLKGLRGKLVRSNKRYFLLKEVPGMGVMLKVTRWCCKAIDTSRPNSL
ncbi:MAG: UpxY family transcription antiterminator [Prevotella sp.]